MVGVFVLIGLLAHDVLDDCSNDEQDDVSDQVSVEGWLDCLAIFHCLSNQEWVLVTTGYYTDTGNYHE